MIGNVIEQAIKEAVEKTLSKKNLPNAEYIATDSLGEIIEKLVILHIRTWMLEDAIQCAKTNDEIAELKKKIDICFKIKRPKFVQAINLMIEDAISRNKSLVEDSVKLYKGIDNV
jgi:hypothetical protein